MSTGCTVCTMEHNSHPFLRCIGHVVTFHEKTKHNVLDINWLKATQGQSLVSAWSPYYMRASGWDFVTYFYQQHHTIS